MNKVFQLLGKPLGFRLSNTAGNTNVVTAQEETYITNGKSAFRFPVGIESIPAACGPIDPPREDGSHSLQNERNIYKTIGSNVDVPLQSLGRGISLDDFRKIFHKLDDSDAVSVKVDLKRMKDIVDALVPFTSGEFNTATLEVHRKDPNQVRVKVVQQDGKKIESILMALVE